MDVRRFKEMHLYPPNRKHKIGVIKNYRHFSGDYRFGAASEISFEVTKRVYNADAERWEENLLYDQINKNMVLYLDDNTDYFTFKGTTIKESDYRIRSDDEIKRGYEDLLTNANLSSYVELFSVNTARGYYPKIGCWIGESGGIVDRSAEILDKTKVHSGTHYYHFGVYDTFFPVEQGDVISLYTRKDSFGDDYFKYRIHYYSESNVNNYLGTAEGFELGYQSFDSNSSSESRIRVDLPAQDVGGMTIKYTKGYARIEFMALKASHKTTDDGTKFVSVTPGVPYIRIFSKNQFCRSFNSTSIPINYNTKIRWWVITNIEENQDSKYSSIKVVTAHSYEYTLSKKYFTLSGQTLPLYIPENIIKSVTSDDWVIDVRTEHDSYEKIVYRGSQNMERGLLNQLLDHLPNWKIGYIDTEIACKYRKFDDIDNGNIYSFLLNDVQSAYQCYFIFDCDNMTINFINGTIDNDTNDNGDAVLGSRTGIPLTWNNAIKNLNINTTDSQFVTALRVHTGSEDKYGIGLVNPLGNNYLYNFDSFMPYMDFIADKEKQRTLSKAVETFFLSLDKDKDIYVSNMRRLLRWSLDLVQQKSAVAKALEEYKVIADKLNIYISEDKTDDYIDEIPFDIAEVTFSPSKSGKHQKLYQDLQAAAYKYKIALISYNDSKKEFNLEFEDAKKTTGKYTLNYGTAKERQQNGEDTILSPDEILALNDFIIEGDWTNENAVIGEIYGGEIYHYNEKIDEVKKVYDEAKSDFDNFLSKQNYEFDVSLVNINFIPEMKYNASRLRLGYSVALEDKVGQWQYPVLLEIHVEHDDLSNCKYLFSTNYKRKPLCMRFSDLFNTITQTSVQETGYTFSY